MRPSESSPGQTNLRGLEQPVHISAVYCDSILLVYIIGVPRSKSSGPAQS
jgi:hypothetical protein